MADRSSLILELEEAIARGSSRKAEDTLERITELFAAQAGKLGEEQIGVFDEVMLHLVGEIETKARAELARRLAPLERAPSATVRQLAFDEEIEVAAPVLLRSNGLDEASLISVAREKSQDHLLAISSRRSLTPSLTDVLVERGDEQVLYNVAANAGAGFSPGGYARLVERAAGDDHLASRIGERRDIPPDLFRKLITEASAIVQRRLLVNAPKALRTEIESVLKDVSESLETETPGQRRFTGALRLMGMLHQSGVLGESELYDLAKSKRYEEAVAALSLLCNVTVEQTDWLMNGDRIEPLLIHLKGAGFDWLTVRALLLLRPGGRRLSAKDLEDICDDFKKLSYATARRVIGHWQGTDTGLRAAS